MGTEEKKDGLNISNMARTSANTPLQQCFWRLTGNRHLEKKALPAFRRI